MEMYADVEARAGVLGSHPYLNVLYHSNPNAH